MRLDDKKRPRRVLIADDNPVVRRLMLSLIQQENHIPVEVADGREAFRMLRSDTDFKAAIIDIYMPHLSGLDLVRYMRTEKRLMRIPVLMITGAEDVKYLTDSFAAGAAAFLPKSFTPEQLRRALHTLLRSQVAITIEQNTAHRT